MNRLLPILAIMLCACAPFQYAGNGRNGPFIVQSGGFWSNTDGVIQKGDNGPIHLEQMVEHQDGTKGPQGLVDGAVSYGAASVLSSEHKNSNNNDRAIKVNDSNNKTKVDLAKEATTLEGVKGTNKVNEINANKP